VTTAQQQASAARYQAKLNQVVDYIHDNIQTDLRPETLADVACLSPYYWHRIYRSMRGESMAETVRRIRLQRSADFLANSATPIAEIAERAHYGSVEAFSRAFKDYAGQSPAAFRESGSHSRFQQANAEVDAAGFQVDVREFPEQIAWAEAATGSYMHIDRAFGALIGRLSANGNMDQDSRIIGVFQDDPDITPEAELQAHACVLSPSRSLQQMEAATDSTLLLRGGRYACLHYQGPYSDMREAHRWLFGVWLPASGYDAADAPMIEEYLNDPTQVPANELQTLICLPIQLADEKTGENA